MRGCFLVLLLMMSVSAWAQNSSPSDNPASSASQSNPQSKPQTNSQSNSQSKDSQPQDSGSSAATKPSQTSAPNLAPPRSDSVNVSALGDEPGESSSKDTQIDLSPPEDDARAHPGSREAVTNAESSSSGADVNEFHPWDPHKAAKDVEVGDFYFKRKNYIGAESRYREALYYKDNDALATFRLAVCLEKMDRLDEALQEYESYLKILPHGPEAEDAQKAIARLKNAASSAKPGK